MTKKQKFKKALHNRIGKVFIRSVDINNRKVNKGTWKKEDLESFLKAIEDLKEWRKNQEKEIFGEVTKELFKALKIAEDKVDNDTWKNLDFKSLLRALEPLKKWCESQEAN